MDDPLILRDALQALYLQRRSRVWVGVLCLGLSVCCFGVWYFCFLSRQPFVTSGELGGGLLIMAVAGYLLIDARERRRAQLQLKNQVAKVAERAPEIIEGIRRARKEGRNVYEFLLSEGLTQPDIRKYLIDRAKLEP